MSKPSNTLRLVFPQWQGGGRPPYHFGAQLLEWLAPPASGPVEHVPVPKPADVAIEVENGIVARAQLLKQQDDAAKLIQKHSPDSIVVIGGDCLVDLAPFAYLSERYGDDFAILWVDAHPDIMTPKQWSYAHAMVLGNLMGFGDEDFSSRVKRPVKPSHVFYAGLEDPSEYEAGFLAEHDLKSASGAALADTSQPVLDWIKSIGVKHIAVHFDLDVLDLNTFKAQLFANPNVPEGTYDGIARGKMTLAQVTRLLKDVNHHADIVGLGFAEHLPWDAIGLKTMFEELPLIGEP
ncbi:arginase family protein [Pseudomonas eucalypticola]|uniref:arginase family protein n=1 Tax=Pseudomonas eucalypticola TaxID=2599595 RepID=UPI001FD7878A|nr:arginase family protein [Pseudomonas eucalypticola]